MQNIEIGDLVYYIDTHSYPSRPRYGVVLALQYTTVLCPAAWSTTSEDAIGKAKYYIEQYGWPTEDIRGLTSCLKCNIFIKRKNVLDKLTKQEELVSKKEKYLSPFSGRWV